MNLHPFSLLSIPTKVTTPPPPFEEQFLPLCSCPIPLFPIHKLQSYNYPLFFLHQPSPTLFCIHLSSGMCPLKKQMKILLSPFCPIQVLLHFSTLFTVKLCKVVKKNLLQNTYHYQLLRYLYLLISHTRSVHSGMTSASITSNIHPANPMNSYALILLGLSIPLNSVHHFLLLEIIS